MRPLPLNDALSQSLSDANREFSSSNTSGTVLQFRAKVVSTWRYVSVNDVNPLWGYEGQQPLRKIDSWNFLVGDQNRIAVNRGSPIGFEFDFQDHGRPDKPGIGSRRHNDNLRPSGRASAPFQNWLIG